MRIMIKGGVWKNTEDEILKAAVMKYGKNQWARISSLLVRKSAKQCKARWYEWLDPSIKKTEWTREEDEKLLHLAKLMPTQWRTIAPIVGRTPSQCLERYEKLLDAACAKDENYEPNDDPRKLRPGEIDPNPESKPARPDPVDMDEDEKEMLSEARARLANTRGKKAKRKAREKQLEEARRLASLQKRRELKAAGIDNRHRRRKRKGIDYNAEIPFEKRPPPGFFDISGEEKPVEQPKFPTTIEELEGKRRVDIEAQLRKQDAAKNKILQRLDAPAAIFQANKLNDPAAARKRAKMMLPAAQISDQEYEEIAKMGYASDLTSGIDDFTEGSGATRALVGDYSQTPRRGTTPLRTPQRTPAGKADAIMMEAENLARLRESQTPLLGGENPELHPSDFSGVTPRKKEIQTPNPLATPMASPGPMSLTPRIGMTPSRDGVGGTPKFTPFRDDLRINEDVEMQNSELHLQEELRRSTRSGLANLAPPKNEYQIVMQPIPEESEEMDDKIEDDMSDKIAREKAMEQARLEALMKKRSKVLQRELPRPPAASLELIKNLLVKSDEDKSSFVPPTSFEQADEMINKELYSLLEHDNAKYPLIEKADKGKGKRSKHAENGKSSNLSPEIEDFDTEELREADSMIKEEMAFLKVAMGHENESFDDFVKARDACQEDLMYFPARSTFGLASVASSIDKLAALQNEFEIVKKKMDDEAKKATRLEQKIKLLTNGYMMRGGKLWSQIEATFKQMVTSATELECFQALQKQEGAAASYRIDDLKEEVNKQKQLERTLQEQYGNLVSDEERILRILDEHKARLQAEKEMAARQRAAEEELTERMRAAEEMNERMLAVEEISARERAAAEEDKAARERAAVAEGDNLTREGAAAEEDKAASEGSAAEEDKATSESAAAEEDMAAGECAAAEENMAARGEVVEEMAARKHAADEEMAVSELATEEDMTSRECATAEEEIAAGESVAKEDMAARKCLVEEEGAARSNLGESIALSENPTIEETPASFKKPVEIPFLSEDPSEQDRIQEPEAAAAECPNRDENSVKENHMQNSVAMPDSTISSSYLCQSNVKSPYQNTCKEEDKVEAMLEEEPPVADTAALSSAAASYEEQKPAICADEELPAVLSPN